MTFLCWNGKKKSNYVELSLPMFLLNAINEIHENKFHGQVNHMILKLSSGIGCYCQNIIGTAFVTVTKTQFYIYAFNVYIYM